MAVFMKNSLNKCYIGVGWAWLEKLANIVIFKFVKTTTTRRQVPSFLDIPGGTITVDLLKEYFTVQWGRGEGGRRRLDIRVCERERVAVGRDRDQRGDTCQLYQLSETRI